MRTNDSGSSQPSERQVEETGAQGDLVPTTLPTRKLKEFEKICDPVEHLSVELSGDDLSPRLLSDCLVPG